MKLKEFEAPGFAPTGKILMNLETFVSAYQCKDDDPKFPGWCRIMTVDGTNFPAKITLKELAALLAEV